MRHVPPYGVLKLIAVCACLALSCDEELPVYLDPRGALSARLDASYSYVFIENVIKIEITIVNVYDETFEGKGIFDGGGAISLRRKPSVQKTFAFPSPPSGAHYDTSTGILRMDRGDTVRFRYTWDLHDDAGNDLRQTEFRFREDPTCPFRMIADQETFILNCRMKLYERVAEFQFAGKEYSFCYISAWVSPRACSPITPEQACSL